MSFLINDYLKERKYVIIDESLYLKNESNVLRFSYIFECNSAIHQSYFEEEVFLLKCDYTKEMARFVKNKNNIDNKTIFDFKEAVNIILWLVGNSGEWVSEQDFLVWGLNHYKITEI